jgi:hypothetical protein
MAGGHGMSVDRRFLPTKVNQPPGSRQGRVTIQHYAAADAELAIGRPLFFNAYAVISVVERSVRKPVLHAAGAQSGCIKMIQRLAQTAEMGLESLAGAAATNIL